MAKFRLIWLPWKFANFLCVLYNTHKNCQRYWESKCVLYFYLLTNIFLVFTEYKLINTAETRAAI